MMEVLSILFIGTYLGYRFSAPIGKIAHRHKKLEPYFVYGLFMFAMAMHMGWSGFIMAWLMPCTYFVLPKLPELYHKARFVRKVDEDRQSTDVYNPVQSVKEIESQE